MLNYSIIIGLVAHAQLRQNTCSLDRYYTAFLVRVANSLFFLSARKRGLYSGVLLGQPPNVCSHKLEGEDTSKVVCLTGRSCAGRGFGSYPRAVSESKSCASCFSPSLLLLLLFITMPVAESSIRLCGVRLTRTLMSICRNQLCGGYALNKRMFLSLSPPSAQCWFEK